MKLSTVLITGANRGIGFALAKHFLSEGWQVIATARRPEEAHELQRLQSESGRVQIVPLDVTEHSAVEALAEQISVPIDILINNAGVIGETFGKSLSLGQIDYRSFRQMFEVNTIAPLKITECFLEHVKKSERKVLAYLSSYMGSMTADPTGGYYGYRSSKAALNRLVRTLSSDLSKAGVIPVALHPGWVKTDMGTQAAPLAPSTSAEGLYKVLLSLTPLDGGAFLDYTGKAVPW